MHSAYAGIHCCSMTPIHSKRGASSPSVFLASPASPAHAILPLLAAASAALRMPSSHPALRSCDPGLHSWQSLIPQIRRPHLLGPSCASCALCGLRGAYRRRLRSSKAIVGRWASQARAGRTGRTGRAGRAGCGTRASNLKLPSKRACPRPKPYASISESAAPLRRTCPSWLRPHGSRPIHSSLHGRDSQTLDSPTTSDPLSIVCFCTSSSHSLIVSSKSHPN